MLAKHEFIPGIASIGYRRDKSLSRYRMSDLQSRSMQAAIAPKTVVLKDELRNNNVIAITMIALEGASDYLKN